MSFKFIKQKIKDVFLIKPPVFNDSRGLFSETYKKSEFIQNGILNDFSQDNFSYSKKHVLRGLHFQKYPYSQAKLVRCLKGSIIDVIVDLRKESDSYLKYLKFKLSDKNNDMLFVPSGFAHGFVVLSDFAYVIYKTDKEYNKLSDSGIIWNDKTLNVDWGIDFEPILSDKDKNQKNY